MSETIVISLCAFFHYFFEVAKRQVSTFYFHKKKEVPKAKGMMLYSYFGIVTKVTGR